jgi:hypothetical protein
MWRRVSIFIIAISFAISGVWGQSNANSPYSIFGLGDLYTAGYTQNPEYGGASTALLQKNIINFGNPAAYRGIDSMRFVIDFAFNGNYKQIADENTSTTARNMNFAYYAVGFRATHWWHLSLGLTPMSNRNYRIGVNTSEYGISSKTYYIGSGNLNQVYLGSSFSLLPNLSVGINFKYLFGVLTETKTVLFPDEIYIRNTQEGYNRKIQDFGISTGLLYSHDLSTDRKLNFGFTYDPKMKISFTEDYLFGATSDDNLENIEDNEIVDTTDYYEGLNKYFYLPHSFSFSVSYSERLKRTATFAIDYSLWEEPENGNISSNVTEFHNSWRISGGYDFTPKWNSATSYFKRSTYVFGAFFEQQYMKINDKNINAFAIAAGIKMPIRRVNGIVNLGLELGQKGMLKDNLIRENYIKLNLKFNFREVWFFERKFD